MPCLVLCLQTATPQTLQKNRDNPQPLLLKASDYSFLIIDDAPINRGILTGKLFEYIGIGHPILALVPDGDAASLIGKNELGLIVHPKNIKQIKDTILKILTAFYL